MRPFQQLLENHGMLTRSQRLFYPRNFNLSPDFIKALKREIATQTKVGLSPDAFMAKLNKAMLFYIADWKKMAKAKKAQQHTDDMVAIPGPSASIEH